MRCWCEGVEIRADRIGGAGDKNRLVVRWMSHWERVDELVRMGYLRRSFSPANMGHCEYILIGVYNPERSH